MQTINVCAVCPKGTRQEDIIQACNFHVQTIISNQLNIKQPPRPLCNSKITLYSNIPKIKSRHININLTVCPDDNEEPS